MAGRLVDQSLAGTDPTVWLPRSGRQGVRCLDGVSDVDEERWGVVLRPGTPPSSATCIAEDRPCERWT